jgi:uncharacterized protein YktA (UPF0223 family)
LNYSYPIDETWTKEEIIEVIQFFQMVERAYESGVEKEKLLQAYSAFKQIVPSKSEEKKVCATFEKESGYSCYRTIKKARESAEKKLIKMP